jgi:phospholipase C
MGIFPPAALPVLSGLAKGFAVCDHWYSSVPTQTMPTARDAAAPDLGGVLTLTTPRTDDPLDGVTAPVSSGTNPAAGTVSHLQQVQAELVSNLPAPLEQVHSAPLLAHQHTPEDFDHYIAARTALWQSTRDEVAGEAAP